MVAQFVSDLYGPFSQARLEAYRPQPGGSDLDMITNYFWNIDLAEALVPCLHAVELALRNSVHAILTNEFGTDMWFYDPRVLEPGQLTEFARSLAKVAKKPGSLASYIVPELPFSFWVALLSGPYDQKLWAANGFARMRSVFPHAQGYSRDQIHRRFNEIRLLRNRVMHYEAVWDQSKLDLYQRHLDIHEAIKWISPTLGQAILSVDNFQAVFNSRTQVEANLVAHLGIL
jgi:hypothetical protein